MNESKQKSRQGKSFLPRRDDGRLKRVSAMENVSWLCKVRACGRLKIASNCSASFSWCMPFFSTCLKMCIKSWSKLSYASNVIAPESGAEKLLSRFTVYDGHSPGSWELPPPRFGNTSDFSAFSMVEAFLKNSG